MKMAQAIQLLNVTGFSKGEAVSIVSKVIGEVEMPNDISTIFSSESEKEPQELEGPSSEPVNNAGVPTDNETGRRNQ